MPVVLGRCARGGGLVDRERRAGQVARERLIEGGRGVGRDLDELPRDTPRLDPDRTYDMNSAASYRCRVDEQDDGKWWADWNYCTVASLMLIMAGLVLRQLLAPDEPQWGTDESVFAITALGVSLSPGTSQIVGWVRDQL